jgi:hypothetical protein
MAQPRNIVTEYYDHKGKVIKTNRAVSGRRANLMALDHLQMGGGVYDQAFCAIVFDEGMFNEMLSVITHSVQGRIDVQLWRDTRKPLLFT